MFDFMGADEGPHALKTWKNIPLDEAIASAELAYKLPRIVKCLVSPLLRLVSYKLYRLAQSGPRLSRDLWVKNAERDALEYNLMAAWEEGGYDVLIAPAWSIPAPPARYCSSLPHGRRTAS